MLKYVIFNLPYRIIITNYRKPGIRCGAKKTLSFSQVQHYGMRAQSCDDYDDCVVCLDETPQGTDSVRSDFNLLRIILHLTLVMPGIYAGE